MNHCTSAPGYKRLFSGVPSDFRCRPENRPSCPNVRFPSNCVSFRSENGPSAEGPFSSPFDPLRKFDTPSQNVRIRTPRRSLEGPNLLERIPVAARRTLGLAAPTAAYTVLGRGESGPQMSTELWATCARKYHMLCFFLKTTKSCCISLKKP